MDLSQIDYRVVPQLYGTKTRYVIVNTAGIIMDDAQGYGYKTEKAAHRCWCWKKYNGK